MITLSLFNENISLEDRTLLAKKIHLQQIPADEVTLRKPTLPLIDNKSEITDFVGADLESSSISWRFL